MRYHCVTPVWGEGHTTLFLEIGLPSLLAIGNLPAMAAENDVRYLIYTRAEDEDRIRRSPVFERLSRLLEIEVRIIAEPLSAPHRVMSDCHFDALHEADKCDAATVFIPPDCVWSDGSFRNVSRIAGSGKSLIHISGIRLDKDAMRAALSGFRTESDQVLEIPARTLVGIGLKNLHRIANIHFWREGDGGLMPANLYWTVGQEGLLLRCFHLHPLLVKPQVRFAKFESTIDDDLAPFACPDSGGDYVVGDSDEILCFEMSGPERVISGDFLKGSTESVAAWAEVGTNWRHQELVDHTIRIHRAEISEELWEPIAAEAEQVVQAAKRINRLSSPALALLHPPVLIWRYYAVGWNRGLHGRRATWVSRVAVQLLRRALHSSRHLKWLFVDRHGKPRPWHPRGHLVTKERLVVVDPEAAAEFQRRADRKRARGDLQGALQSYTDAIKVSPPNTALYYLRGITHLDAGSSTLAAEDFRAALRLDPANTTISALLEQASGKVQLQS